EAAGAFFEAARRAITERALRTAPLARSMPESSSESSASDTAASAIARLRFPLACEARCAFGFAFSAPAGEGLEETALPRPADPSLVARASPARSAAPLTIPAEKAS